VKLGDTPTRNDENAVRQIEDVVFVMNPDTSELHSFNEVGHRIWDLVDGSRTVATIVETIVDEYEIDRETAEDDVLKFLQRLQDKDVVRI
jgi:Coenzyme PQQ synthesis protein D (PqqD)